jgi:hypothetical protein
MKQTLKMTVNNHEVEITIPTTGMLGTYFVGSDRYAVVCLHAFSNKKCNLAILYDYENIAPSHIITTEDGTMYLDEEMIAKYAGKKALEEAKYPDEESYNFLDYSLRKNGVWYRKGDPIQPGCGGVIFGTANPYRDPSF